MKRARSKLSADRRIERYPRLALSPTDSQTSKTDNATLSKLRHSPVPCSVPSRQSFSSPSQSPFVSPPYQQNTMSVSTPTNKQSQPQSSNSTFASSNRLSLPKPNIAAFSETQLGRSSSSHSYKSTPLSSTDPFKSPVSSRASRTTHLLTPLSVMSRSHLSSVSSPALSDSKRRFIEKSSFLSHLVPLVSPYKSDGYDENAFDSSPLSLSYSEEESLSPISCMTSAASSPSNLSTPRSAASQHLDRLSQQLLEVNVEVDDCIQSTSPVHPSTVRLVPQHTPDSSTSISSVHSSLPKASESWRGTLHIDETLLYNMTQTQTYLSQPPSSNLSPCTRSCCNGQLTSDSSPSCVTCTSHDDIVDPALFPRDALSPSYNSKRRKLS